MHQAIRNCYHGNFSISCVCVSAHSFITMFGGRLVVSISEDNTVGSDCDILAAGKGLMLLSFYIYTVIIKTQSL